MRKHAVAAIALPVLVMVYLPVLARRALGGRFAIMLGVTAIAGIVAFGLVVPGATQARPPVLVSSLAPTALDGTIETGHELHTPIRLTFSQPMDGASVTVALHVDPATPLSLSWDGAGRLLTIAPTNAWQASTYYTMSIGAAAHDRSGRALAGPVRALFTTRGTITGTFAASSPVGPGGLNPAAAFTVTYGGQVDAQLVAQAFRIAPLVAGTFATSLGSAGGTVVSFTPTTPLAADTEYTVSIVGSVLDVDGAPTGQPQPLTVRTAVVPTIVRFRPASRATAVPASAALSVRFSLPMARAATAAAFSATVGAKSVAGTIVWFEGDTVLVLRPARPLMAGATIVLHVGTSARDRNSVALGAPATSTFVVARTLPAASKQAPVVKPPSSPTKVAPRPTSKPVPIPTGGVVVGAGAWHAAELYYLKLMNCTRGGGWVTTSGACDSPGGSGIAPLILSAAISDRVSRPYARLVAERNICSHFADGTPGDRLRAAGYAGDYRENLGCYPASPLASALATHLFFQSEKPCGGYCHYANIMSTSMKYVGIGMWITGGRVRLVIDFWAG